MPVIMFMIVDLPLPDGPTIATMSPPSFRYLRYRPTTPAPKAL